MLADMEKVERAARMAFADMDAVDSAPQPALSMTKIAGIAAGVAVALASVLFFLGSI